jgi:hypothetical protein
LFFKPVPIAIGRNMESPKLRNARLLFGQEMRLEMESRTAFTKAPQVLIFQIS